MNAPIWTGPPIGVMRPGFLAVSGCRPPKEGVTDGRHAQQEWALFDLITSNVRRTVREARLIVVHGRASGVDTTAKLAAVRADIQHEQHGRVAPMVRNVYVTTAERFIAWPAPWSRGTWDAVEKRLKHCGLAGFELRLVGWGKGGEGVPAGVKAMLGKLGATWTEVEG